MDKDKLLFKSQVRATKPVSCLCCSHFVICTSSWWLWVHLGCQSLGGMDTGWQHCPAAGNWSCPGLLHGGCFTSAQYSRANSSGVDPPQPQPHTRVSRLAQRQLPLILQLLPGFRCGLTSAALASTGDLPAGQEAALGGWARDGPGPAQRQGHTELGLVLLFRPHECTQPHTHAHAILLALL